MRSPWLGPVVAAIAVAASVLAYPHLPDRMPVHWNVRGEIDGHGPRLLAVSIVPLVIAAFVALMAVVPKIDPKGRNYEKFRDTYWLLINGVVLFFAGIHGMLLAVGLGYDVRVNRVVPLGVGLLLVLLGNYLTRVEPNWFVGIRTPWTLSSDRVWRKTHRAGGWLFVGAGAATAALGFWSSRVSVTAVLVVIAVAVLVPVVQSYVLWRREQTEQAEGRQD